MLRKELQPPLINKGLVNELMELIDYIATTLEDEGYVPCHNGDVIVPDEFVKDLLNGKLERINLITHKNYNFMDFVEYWSCCDIKEIAQRISLPKVPTIDNISLQDVTSIIEYIDEINSDISKEYLVEYYFELLEDNLNICGASEYIYYPKSCGLKEDCTLEEIAEAIYNAKGSIMLI